MVKHPLLLGSLLALLTCMGILVGAQPSCTDVNLKIKASALNVQLPVNHSKISLDFLKDLPRIPVSDTYNISARYCDPERSNAKRRNTIQLLVHGVSYTKDYWSGLGLPGQGYDGDKYSYIARASKQGYPTLAIDRVCNGDSSKPNGLLACQLPLNSEILYQIVLQIRYNSVVGQRNFEQVIPVCHSEGSTICQYLMQIHPNAPVASYVLTAFSNEFLVAGPGTVAVVGLLPAVIAKPLKYPSLDLTYFLTTNARGAQGAFYYGAYDKQLASYDFSDTHPIPAGEFATSALSQLPAPGYTGSLLLLNGANDQVFCAVLPTDPLLGFRGDCGAGPSSITAKSQALFPHAHFHWQQIRQTGHDINLHETTQQSFNMINDYLLGQGF